MDITKERRAELEGFATRLGVKFHDISILHIALTHSSYAHVHDSAKRHVEYNERLEFLGDAVLELASSTTLFHQFPEASEGKLTKSRAFMVCEASLAELAADLGVGEHLLLSVGERQSGGSARPSILADTFEAIIGAIYLDRGWEEAFAYVNKQLKKRYQEVKVGNGLKDYKTILQEWAQANDKKITYKLLAEEGPAHYKKFRFAVFIDETSYGEDWGMSKKEAEQKAAWHALKKLPQVP